MSYSVLVVDDEDLTLRTVSRGLRQEGFEVFTAASGEDALTIFAEQKPDRARVVPLAVAGAFHTRFMAPAEEALRVFLVGRSSAEEAERTALGGDQPHRLVAFE